ncbi:DUF4336 domain-containing protein [Aureimonas psammosilenae]|uniref:DUF4336 domain-containing protein n=1 Tax=Aureimonas psammosilenae TaxID=2495496 RepID=UPI001260F93B|nr:DUF4336 domain-containing protein [Aureimonas psammosilenae]
MNDTDVTYPPLDVPKEVAEGVFVVDSGPIRAMGIPLPVRMSAIRLGNGGLLLHSPTRYSAALHEALERIGPIRHLVAPNSAHWTYLKEWQDHLPQAKTWAAPGLRERGQVKRSGVRLDADLGPGRAEWDAEVDQVAVPGIGGFCEVALFHKASRTLLLTDLVQNLEPEKLPAPMRVFARLAGNAAPNGRAPAYLRAVIALRGNLAREAARRIVAFEPERVIFTHGAWFETDGAARLRRSLDWLLK